MGFQGATKSFDVYLRVKKNTCFPSKEGYLRKSMNHRALPFVRPFPFDIFLGERGKEKGQ